MNSTSSIPEPWRKRYLIARSILILAFIAAGSYFSFLILFPSQTSIFDFKNPRASKNTLLEPHAPDGASLEKGNLTAQQPFIIDASVIRGDYSLLHISLIPDKKSGRPNGSIDIRKSYRAFFLPLGAPISEPAHFDDTFHSGTLLSFADGVFLIDGNQIRPIGDATIFEALGYSWEDVVPASEEDMGMFEKGKMVMLGNTHPDGTVLYATDTDNYFLIQGGEKHRIVSHDIAQSYLHDMHPIRVSESALNITETCTLTLGIGGFFNATYECETPIDTLESLPGDSYRLTIHSGNTVSLQSMETVFADTINKGNMHASLSQIKQRILAHYGVRQ